MSLAENKNKIWIGAAIVGALGIGGYLIYKMGASSASSVAQTADDVNAARNNVTLAKQALNNVKADPTATSVALAAAQKALSTANQKLADSLKAAQTAQQQQSKSGGGGSTGGSGGTPSGKNPQDSSIKKNGNDVPVSVVDPNGNYIEKGDPSTLYDKNGNVIGNKNDFTGTFQDPKTGLDVAASDGTAIISLPNGDYFEKGDPTTLYHADGSHDDYDPESGTFKNSAGITTALADGTKVLETDDNGNTKLEDGTWQNQAGQVIDPPIGSAYDPSLAQTVTDPSQPDANGTGFQAPPPPSGIDLTPASTDTSTASNDGSGAGSSNDNSDAENLGFDGNTVHARRRSLTGTTSAIDNTKILSYLAATIIVGGAIYYFSNHKTQ